MKRKSIAANRRMGSSRAQKPLRPWVAHAAWRRGTQPCALNSKSDPRKALPRMPLVRRRANEMRSSCPVLNPCPLVRQALSSLIQNVSITTACQKQERDANEKTGLDCASALPMPQQPSLHSKTSVPQRTMLLHFSLGTATNYVRHSRGHLNAHRYAQWTGQRTPRMLLDHKLPWPHSFFCKANTALCRQGQHMRSANMQPECTCIWPHPVCGKHMPMQLPP